MQNGNEFYYTITDTWILTQLISVSSEVFLSVKVIKTLSYFFPKPKEHLHGILPYFLHN